MLGSGPSAAGDVVEPPPVMLDDRARPRRRVLDRLAVAGVHDAQAELGCALERGEVVAERIGTALEIKTDGGRDRVEQVIAADQDAVAQEADVAVGVARKLEHRPAVQLASLVQQLGVVREADERGERVALLDQLAR